VAAGECTLATNGGGVRPLHGLIGPGVPQGAEIFEIRLPGMSGKRHALRDDGGRKGVGVIAPDVTGRHGARGLLEPLKISSGPASE